MTIHPASGQEGAGPEFVLQKDTSLVPGPELCGEQRRNTIQMHKTRSSSVGNPSKPSGSQKKLDRGFPKSDNNPTTLHDVANNEYEAERNFSKL